MLKLVFLQKIQQKPHIFCGFIAEKLKDFAFQRVFFFSSAFLSIKENLGSNGNVEEEQSSKEPILNTEYIITETAGL